MSWTTHNDKRLKELGARFNAETITPAEMNEFDTLHRRFEMAGRPTPTDVIKSSRGIGGIVLQDPGPSFAYNDNPRLSSNEQSIIRELKAKHFDHGQSLTHGETNLWNAIMDKSKGTLNQAALSNAWKEYRQDVKIGTTALSKTLVQPQELGSIARFGISAGYSAEETERMLRQQFPRGTTQSKARAFLADRFDIKGYKQYEKTYKGLGNDVRPMSFAQWQRQSEHSRLRRMNQRHISTFDTDDFGNPILGNFVRRKNEAFAFPQRVFLEGSPIGRSGNQIVTTVAENKLLKRAQTWGAHEMIELHGPNVGRPQPAAMRSGEMSRRPETIQRMNVAAIIGGDADVAGQGYIMPSVTLASSRKTKTIWSKTPDAYSGIPDVGKWWRPEEGYRLAAELEIEKAGSKYGHAIVGRRTIKDTSRKRGDIYGTQFAIQQFADPKNVLARQKFSFSKSELAPATGQWTTGSGAPLNVDMVTGLKDVGGYVFSAMAQESPERLSKMLNIPADQLQKMSYASLGDKPLQAFEQYMLKERIQTIVSPEGRRLQALVGPVGVQASEDWPVREPRLSADEMRSLWQHHPEAALNLAANPHSERVARSYQHIVQASYANTGRGATPKGTVIPQVERVSKMLEQAELNARASMPKLGAADPVPDQVMRKHFADLWEQEGAFWKVGNTVMLPGKSMGRFRTSGGLKGGEASRLTGEAHKLLATYVSGNKDKFADAQSRFAAQQLQIAGGENAIRYATSVFPSKKQMTGTVVRGAHPKKLAPHEIYVSGMGGQAIHVTGFPSQGGVPYQMLLQSLTEKEIVKRGLDPESFYVGVDVNQAIARDYDGDLAYAINAGELIPGKDGKLYTKDGQKLTSPTKIKHYANLAP